MMKDIDSLAKEVEMLWCYCCCVAWVCIAIGVGLILHLLWGGK